MGNADKGDTDAANLLRIPWELGVPLTTAEREAIGEVRGTPPVMLLDDAMSELDALEEGLVTGWDPAEQL